MSTTTTEQTDQQKQDRRRLPKMLRNVDATAQAPEPAKKADAKKPAPKPTTTTEKAAPAKAKKPATAKPKTEKKPAAKPDYLRTRGGVEEQKCAGACGTWKPLDAFAKKSAARGGGPIRRCKQCITDERKARQAAKAPAEKTETTEKETTK